MQNLNKHIPTLELFVSLFIMFSWSAIFFSGLQWYLQFLFVHEKMIPSHLPLLGLLALPFLYLLFKNKVYANDAAIALIVLFLYIVIANSIVITIYGVPELSTHLIIAYLLVSPTYYALISLILAADLKINEQVASRVIIFFGVLSIVVGTGQQLFGYSPLEINIFNAAKVNNYYFYGSVRPTSIFLIPGEYGVFLALLMAILISYLLGSKSNKVIKYTLIFIAFSLAVLEMFSYSRNGMLFMALSLTYLFVYFRSRGKRFLIYSPAIYFLFGLIIYLSIPMLSPMLHYFIGGIASNKSMFMRYNELYYYTTLILNGSYVKLLFGSGLTQYVSLNKGIYIDNTYLYILMEGGVIGLIIWIVAMVEIWRYLFCHNYYSASPLRAALLSLLAVWPAVAFFISTQEYLFVTILLVFVTPRGGSLARTALTS